METFIILSIFILIMLVPLTFFALFMKAVPKLKTWDSKPYTTEIDLIQDSVHKNINEEDIKRVRGRLRNSIAVPAFTVVLDIFAVLGLVNISRKEEVAELYIILVFFVVILLSVICISRSLKKNKVFKDLNNFQKTKGCILKYKEIYVPNRGAFKGVTLYEALIGLKDSNGNPMVVKDTLPEFIFSFAKKRGYCVVVLYKGNPVTVIRE